MKRALNRVLREQPNDPLSGIASMLIGSAKKSYPVFKKFEARRIFLDNSINWQTLQIDVHLQYQGRTEVKHSHIFTYDESNHGPEFFNWDKPDEKSGLTNACKMINEELNAKLQNVVLSSNI